MMTHRLLAPVLFVALALGCSASSQEDASAETTDDIVVNATKKQVNDLFKPDEATLVKTVTSSLDGLATWKFYVQPSGVTVRGVSASNKIKVVYVIATRDIEQASGVSAIGYLHASDFPLPSDAREATLALEKAIHADLGGDGTGTVKPQAESADSDCYTESLKGLLGGLVLFGTTLSAVPVLAIACASGALPLCMGGSLFLLAAPVGGIAAIHTQLKTCPKPAAGAASQP